MNTAHIILVQKRTGICISLHLNIRKNTSIHYIKLYIAVRHDGDNRLFDDNLESYAEAIADGIAKTLNEI